MHLLTKKKKSHKKKKTKKKDLFDAVMQKQSKNKSVALIAQKKNYQPVR